MRTTSFLKNASTLHFCSPVMGAFFILASLLAEVVCASEIQDLGTTEIVEPTPSPSEIPPSYEEIFPESWEGKGLSVMEVLSALPGIQGRKHGGMGSFQTVSVRGVAARNILICIDGVPLNDASGGAANIGSIDLNNIEKIEIYKDRVPVKFGGSGLGGAINFVTKSALRNGGKVVASVGSNNSFEGSAQVTVNPTDSMQFSATLSARHSDNDYEFLNRNGTAYNKDDDFTDKRNNAEFTEYTGNLKYRILHSGNFFSTVMANVEFTESGVPGFESSQTKVANFTGENAQLSYRIEAPILLQCLLVEAGVSGKFEKNVSGSYYPLDYIGYSSADYLEYGLAGYRLIPEILGMLILDRLEANLRLSLSAERWEARGSIQEFGLSRVSGSAAGSVEFAFTHWFSLLAEGNVLKTNDDIDGGKFVMPTGTAKISDGENRDMSLGGMVQAKFGKKESFFGGNVSVGRFYRQPQLMELYGVYNGVLSNPKLKEEIAYRFEAGAFALSPSKKSLLRVSYFENHIENGIFWISSANAVKAFNLDKALIRGVELELNSRPNKWFETTLRGTIQDPRDKSNANRYKEKLLVGEPVQSYYSEGKIYIPFNFDITFSTDYRTRIYSDRQNFTRLPPVAHYNAALGWNPLSKTRLIVAVTNISDETYTNIFSSQPTPGREYHLTLSQKF